MRKVVMIACNPQLHALCDDGTVWQHVSPQGWRRIEPIPDDSRASPVTKDPILDAANRVTDPWKPST
jgi:hypothetical protein